MDTATSIDGDDLPQAGFTLPLPDPPLTPPGAAPIAVAQLPVGPSLLGWTLAVLYFALSWTAYGLFCNSTRTNPTVFTVALDDVWTAPTSPTLYSDNYIQFRFRTVCFSQQLVGLRPNHSNPLALCVDPNYRHQEWSAVFALLVSSPAPLALYTWTYDTLRVGIAQAVVSTVAAVLCIVIIAGEVWKKGWSDGLATLPAHTRTAALGFAFPCLVLAAGICVNYTAIAALFHSTYPAVHLTPSPLVDTSTYSRTSTAETRSMNARAMNDCWAMVACSYTALLLLVLSLCSGTLHRLFKSCGA